MGGPLGGFPPQNIIIEAAKSNPWITAVVGIIVAVVSGMILEWFRRKRK